MNLLDSLGENHPESQKPHRPFSPASRKFSRAFALASPEE
jgi:hypothetical protein